MDSNYISQYRRALSSVVRFNRERLPVSAMHPELQYTRLGAHLREAATTGDEIGQLAHAVLTNADHEGKPRLDQPLELTTLHALRDAVTENPSHPLAKTFNWDVVPDGVHLDQVLSKHINDYAKTLPPDADYRLQVTPIMVRTGGSHPQQIRVVSSISDAVRKHFDGQLSYNDIANSSMRLQLRDGRRWLHHTSNGEEEHAALGNSQPEGISRAESFPHRTEKLSH